VKSISELAAGLPAFPVPAKMDWGMRGFSYALEESHLPGLIIVVVLVLLSIVSWSVMFTKVSMVMKARSRNRRFYYAFRNAKNMLAAYESNAVLPGSPLFAIYRAGCRELAFHLLGTADPTDAAKAQMNSAVDISPEQLEAVRCEMDRSIGESVVELENRMNFLATAVSGAPFLGLLGTVWGVMETFSGMASAQGPANLQAMAPGVAAALVTTVIGLLVAIPAMFGYNYLVNRIRGLILEMNNFAAELTTAFERRFVRYAPRMVESHAAYQSPAPAPYQEPPHHSHYAGPATAPVRSAAFLPASAAQDPAQGDSFYPEDSYVPGPPTPAPVRARLTEDPSGPPINPIAMQARRNNNNNKRP